MSSVMIDCTGTPPTFFDKWTYDPADQPPNLYKGVLDMSSVDAVQAPSQKNGYTRLDVIERELGDHEFVGAHAVEWCRRPEKRAALLKVCPSGYLVFVEKYRYADRSRGVVYLRVPDGQVCIVDLDGGADLGFDARDRFAVRRKSSA